ncbi:hypothetical protein R2R35_12585 [Anaerocolumna sp. AGMB13020]|uniref:hypothetical protein n=1 Tax=Anaerocolumna sp. AGMB13020 TaxID=3081750 RepID=UPI0029535CAE|nr:hypothetical protein [Anaerocolumna sp. AGMB13020]WOO34638.1 hypothetical protein R2R35_12585 [Anaerocolumna sp. AGMB13020]
MSKKSLKLISALILIIILILFFYKNSINRVFVIDLENISYVTIQYKTQVVTLKEDKNLNEFKNDFHNIKFNYDKNALGSKGWIYNIKCYSDDSLVYNFQVISNDTILYNGKFYITNRGNININYLSTLF